MVFAVWILPYFLGGIPFIIYFHSDRTKWLKDNGFYGADTDKDKLNTFTMVVTILSIALPITFAVIFKTLIYKRQIKDDKQYKDIKKKIEDNLD